MNQNKHSDLRYKKLTAEAIIKSLIRGMLVAFGAVFVLGAIFWITGINNLPLVIGFLGGTLVLVTASAGAIFYFAKLRPTIVTNARRIDSIGLEERAVTMLEFKNEDSVMINLQRNDALNALSKVDEKAISFRFNKKIITAFAITAVLSLAMSTVSSLSAAGLLPSGSELIVEANERPEYVPISYIAEDGGYIEGETDQLVLLGENADPVVAVPEEGYSFEGWDDSYKKPTRHDKEIDHPLVLTAIFVPIGDDGEDMGDDMESGEDGEAPGEEQGDGSDDPGEEGTPGEETEPGESGASKYNKANQIIDGESYYREFLEEYRDDIIELLKKKTEELTEEERAIIEAYINIV